MCFLSQIRLAKSVANTRIVYRIDLIPGRLDGTGVSVTKDILWGYLDLPPVTSIADIGFCITIDYMEVFKSFWLWKRHNRILKH